MKRLNQRDSTAELHFVTSNRVMERINFHDRWVAQITSEEGQRHYYSHFKHWRICRHNANPCLRPSQDDAAEYLRLKSIKPTYEPEESPEKRRDRRKLQLYNSRYDWRPHKSGGNGFVGLVSPTGEQFLPEFFVDVFTQFDAINHKPDFVPVFNGVAWGLVSLSSPPVLLTDFIYSNIIPERWEHTIFFVQDEGTKLWGAMSVECPILNINRRFRDRLCRIEQIMPTIADEIYEDSLTIGDDELSIFMTRKGDKIGILTDFGYSRIEYDTYETKYDSHAIRLIRYDRKRAKRVDYFHPDGKDLFLNLKRRKNNSIYSL